MTKIQNSDNSKYVEGQELSSLLVGMRTDAATLEDSLHVSYKAKHTVTV